MRKALFSLLVITLTQSLFGDISFIVPMNSIKKDLYSLVAEKVSESFLVGAIEVVADIPFSKGELLRLADFKEGHVVKAQQLAQLLTYLRIKNRFKSLVVSIQDGDNGALLRFELQAEWLLARVGFSGIALGKARYLQYYDMQLGEVFSEEKHKESLKKLQQIFESKGYKEVVLTDDVTYKESDKVVRVQIGCDKGIRFTVGEISIICEGVNEEPEKLKEVLFENYLKTLCLRAYNEDTLNKATKKLKEHLLREGFLQSSIKLQEEVDTTQKTVTLFFTIKVTKEQKFDFFGNHFLSNAQLYEQILRFGDSVRMLPPAMLAQDIVKVYYKKGFWDVQVEIQEEDKTYFVVKEGPRSSVKSISIKGAHSFPYKKVERFFYNFCKAPFFDETVQKRAIDSLLSFYKKRGFWDVVILKRHYEKAKKSNQLIITIDEGKQRMLADISIPDYESLEKKGPFLSIKRRRKAIPFDKNYLKEQSQWLIAYFRKQGFARVSVEPTLHDDKGKITVEWQVDIGQPIVWGKTIVQGTSSVSANVINTLLHYQEGCLWSKEAFQGGYARLKATDIFKQIRIHPEHNKENVQVRDMVVQLHDDEPFEVRTRLGFQQVSKNFALKKGSTYKVGTSFLWRNPFKCADNFLFNIDVTHFERTLDFSYQRPCLFNSPIATIFKLYANKYTQPATGSSKSLYEVTQEGMLASAVYKKEHMHAGINSGFEWVETKNLSSSLATTINFETNLIGKKVPYFFIEPNFFIDLLDDKVNPQKGLFAIASLKGMFPFNEGSYLLKVIVEQGMFFPLIRERSVICAIRTRFGHIFRESFSKIMPPERFYLGGANSLRGYLPDSCSPLGSYLDDKGRLQRVPQGGKSMVNINVELRIPFSKQFGVVVFQDFGVLAKEVTSLNSGENNAVVSGCGLRYQTPLGPLRFDIGWKWKRAFKEDTRYAWFLTFGHAF